MRKPLIAISLLLAMLIMFMANSCTDLEEEILDEAQPKELLNDPNSISALVNPAYAGLRPLGYFWDYGGLQLATTDEAMFPTRGTDWDDGGQWRQLHKHEWDANHGVIGTAWNTISSGMSKCNTALTELQDVKQSETVEHYKAELTALKAYYAYLFFDTWRKVPFREIGETNYLKPGKILEGQEAFNKIENMLTTALETLKGRDELPYGRVNKSMANTLLAKLYLNKEVYLGNASAEDYQEVIDYCDAVISTGNYQLSSTREGYFDMFNPQNHEDAYNSENIFVSIFSANEDLGNNITFYHFTLHYNQDFGIPEIWPWNGACATPDLVSRFIDTADVVTNPALDPTPVDDYRFRDSSVYERLAINLGFLTGPQYSAEDKDQMLETRKGLPLIFTPEVPLNGANERQGIRVVKYEPDLTMEIGQGVQGNDRVIFRYADVILMKAEAQIRKNGAGEGDNAFNQLRNKRGVSEMTNVTLDNILDERMREFYWEGHRRTDQIRFGTWDDAWHEHPAKDGTDVFPVPASAAASNPNLQ